MSIRGVFSSVQLVLAAVAGLCLGAVIVLGFVSLR